MEKKIEITLKLTYEVDGEVDLFMAQRAVIQDLSSAITSEDFDGSDGWALLLERWEVLDATKTP